MPDPGELAQYARDIAAARDRLVAFVHTCGDDDWTRAVIAGDPRPVGIVVDHVADAYEYGAGWIRQILAGNSPPLSAELVDELNAGHAAVAIGLSRAQVVEHLTVSGDLMIALVGGMRPEALYLDDGRVRRLVEIAVRHADNHRDEIEAGLAARPELA